MANQIIIDIGAVANDGTGDPLRTAFGYVNNNFSNVWASGVANSNIQFDGNRILTTNTNGNLVLAPNGIGKVQANVDIVPNANNTVSLGSLTRKWNTVYTQYLEVSGDVEFSDLTVNGNLTVIGNTIQIGNIVTDTKTIQLANTASTANAANGSGITVGANDNIATFLYNSASNVWTTNIGLTVTGNLTTFTGTVSSNNVVTQNDLFAKRGTFSGDPVTGDASLYIGSPSFTNLGTDVMAQFTGNVTNYAQINLQNYGNSNTASGDYIITADNGTDSTHFLNLGLTGSNWDGSQPNSLGNRLGPNDGYLYVQDGDMVIGTANGTIETWKFGQDGTLTAAGDIVPVGNNTQSLGSATNQWSDLWVSNSTIYMNSVPITLGAGNVLTVNGEALLSNDSNTTITTTGNITADYFIGNGALLTGITSYGNANVAAYLPTYTGNINAGNINVVNDLSVQDDVFAKRGTFSGDPVTGDASMYVGSPSFTNLGTDVMAQFTGNVTNYAQINLQNYGNSPTASGDYIITADNGTDSSHFLNLGLTGSNWDGTQPNSLGNRLGPNDGYLYVQDGDFVLGTSNGTIETWKFDQDGNVTIPGSILGTATVAIDNRGTGNTADIQLYSADDILLQARDRTVGDDIEGGDINIYAGDGSPDDAGGGTGTGGDIQIIGGVGGAADVSSGGSGGTVRLDAGNGGDGSATATAGSGATTYLSAGDGGVDNGGGGNNGGDVVITAGDTTDVAQDRGSIILNAGAGGDETTVGGYVQVSIPSVGANPGGDWTFTGSGTVLEVPQNAEIYQPNFGNLTVGAAGNTIITSADYGITTYNWVFDNAGGIVFPTLTVTRGDRTGTLTGSTVRIGNGTQEALLTTPNGTGGSDSQRLVINPGAGDEFGEGGDIYLYSGRGGADGGSGGDIKIRGGLGPADGNGGYIDIVGGEADGNGVGGAIDILGGQSANSSGGDVRIYGGQGTTGGDANITGGVSTAGPGGGVNITGGTSSNGLAEYGNVNITSGSSTWTFNNTGNLTLPQGGTISEGPSPSFLGQAFTITPANGNDADQQLKIYPTIAEGNHLHLTTGNLYNTEMYVGDDNLYIKLSNTGNVVVNSNDALGNTAQWTFDTTGTLTAPGNINATGNVSGANLFTAGSVNVAGNVNLTGAEGSDTARIFADVSGSDTSLVLEVGDDNADSIVLRHYSFAAGNTIDMLTATRVSNTSANVSVVGNVNAVGGTFTGNVTATNFSGNISITGNVIGTQPNVTLVAGSYSYTFDNTGILTLPTGSSGNEGGEIAFTQAANSTLAGNTVVIDQYVDQIRFFESGGNTRGAYIDLTQAADGVGTLLNNRVSARVDAGTFVTMDNLKVTVTSSGNRGLSVAAVSGSFSADIGGWYGGSGAAGGDSVNNLSVTTTPSASLFSWNFVAEANTAQYTIFDNTNNRVYRVTMMIGPAYLNNFISIERLL